MELALFTTTRVLHIASAIVLVGGTFFVRFVLMPAATANLADDVHAKLRGAIMATWKKIVHLGIVLFIATGAINYGHVIVLGTHKGDPLYNALLGIKIILALVVFFIASVLVGRSAKFDGMRRNARYWLFVNLLLAAVIVALSGFLKVRDVPTGLKASRSQADSPSERMSSFSLHEMSDHGSLPQKPNKRLKPIHSSLIGRTARFATTPATLCGR